MIAIDDDDDSKLTMTHITQGTCYFLKAFFEATFSATLYLYPSVC